MADGAVFRISPEQITAALSKEIEKAGLSAPNLAPNLTQAILKESSQKKSLVRPPSGVPVKMDGDGVPVQKDGDGALVQKDGNVVPVKKDGDATKPPKTMKSRSGPSGWAKWRAKKRATRSTVSDLPCGMVGTLCADGIPFLE